MSAITHVRFYPSDWLAGTRGLTAAETGIYITLIAMMYERGGPLQEEMGRLARLCGASNSTFAKTLDTLVSEGKVTRSEHGLFNSRVRKELSYVMEKSEVARGKAKTRWGNNVDKSTSDAYTGNAVPMLNISHKPIAKEEDTASAASSSASAPAIDFVEVERRCCQAAGAERLGSFAPIREAIERGADMDRDILPVLRSRPASGGAVSSWKFYAPIIAERIAVTKPAAASPEIAAKMASMVWIDQGSDEWEAWRGSGKRWPVKDHPETKRPGWYVPSAMPPGTSHISN